MIPRTIPGSIALVALTCLGCCRSVVGGGPEVDEEKAISQAVTDDQGAALQLEHDRTRAHVVALPGAFPSGATLTLAPLSSKSGLEGKLASTAFSLTARLDGKEVQPKLPVFLSFEVPGSVPEGAAFVSYAASGGKGQAIPTNRVTEGSSTVLSAEVGHFTIFGIDEDGKARLVPQPTDWKEWHIKVHGAPIHSDAPSNEFWEFNTHFELDAVNTTGHVAGPYRGIGVYRVQGNVKKGAIPTGILKAMGKIDGKGAGPAQFQLIANPAKRASVKTASAKGDPKTDVGEWVTGDGSLKLLNSTGTLDIKVTGPGASGSHSDRRDEFNRSYPVHVTVSHKGAFVRVEGVGTWRALLVGVPNKKQ
jgi:hypothetical protein